MHKDTVDFPNPSVENYDLLAIATEYFFRTLDFSASKTSLKFGKR